MKKLKRALSPAEMQQKLNVQRFNLERLQGKISERMEGAKKEAKDALVKGDESAFRVASRRYSLSKNTVNSINDLREMAMEMIDLVDMGGILHSVIEAGGDLTRIQSNLGLDSSKLEASLGKIRTSMTHMEDIADVLSATIESSLASPKQLSTDQEILRKELLVEMQAERSEGERLREQVSKEMQKT